MLQAALPLAVLTHISECVFLQSFVFVVVPRIIRTEGDVTGQAGLHSSSFTADVTYHLLIFSVKQANKVHLLLFTA